MRNRLQIIALAAVVAATGCDTTEQKKTTLSPDFKKPAKRKISRQQKGHQIVVPWKKAAIDAGDHVVVTEIPKHWPSSSNLRYTKRDGKSIEFYPPGGSKTGDRITITRIFNELSPDDYVATNHENLKLWCGTHNTHGYIIRRHNNGITALSLCGSVGGGSSIASSLNKEGEANLFRVANAPGGLYKIAYYRTGKSFDAKAPIGKGGQPLSEALLHQHVSALSRVHFCNKRNPSLKCAPFID